MVSRLPHPALTAATLAVLILPLPRTTMADVAINNGGFQTGSFSPWVNLTGVTILPNIGPAGAGDYSAYIPPTVDVWASEFGAQPGVITGVSPYTGYSVSFDVKSADVTRTTGSLTVSAYNGGWGQPTVTATTTVNQGDLIDGLWHHVTFPYTTDSDGSMKIDVHGAGSHIAMYFDNFTAPFLASTWTPTAAGTYSWNTNSNWSTAFPNATGAIANLNTNLAGNQTINLNQAIIVGTLTAGDSAGSPASTTTIASGTGGNPLTFQAATAGAPTAININMTTQTSPISNAVVNLASGVKLGGTSPLTATVNSSLPQNCAIGTLDLNGNTFTLKGTGRKVDGGMNPTAGALWTINTITGNGAYVQNGAGTALGSDATNFTGTITINDGPFSTVNKLTGVTQYAVGGAFETTGPTVNGNTPGKYPIGGSFTLGSGSWPPVSTLPDRLNHNGVLVFNSGGSMQYNGQKLAPAIAGSAVQEQVNQIKINPGMSELLIQGALGSGSTQGSVTLLVNAATNGCVRQQGGTFLIGGDNGDQNGGTFWTALGGVENLKFTSGLSQYMIGGGGAPGSQNVSIIPWMLGTGTIYHPGMGRMVTYGSNGVRCLALSEYYSPVTAGKVVVYGAPSTANVASNLTDGAFNQDNGDPDLNLGTNHTQTINSFSTNSWGNTDIGPGSTLTITSGLVQFQGSGGSIGNGTPANAGTLNFGSHEGIICSVFQAYNPNVIGSVITGSGGLTTAGTNVLIFKGANTYTGKTVVGAGILQIGDGTLTTSCLGNGNVEVTTGATLLIKSNVANAIADTASVGLDNSGAAFFGRMQLEAGINETIAGLWLGGVCQPSGTYGSSSSSATYKLDNYFSGPGIVTSLGSITPVPEPTALGFLAVGSLLLARRRR